jgi:hypothetical protein
MDNGMEVRMLPVVMASDDVAMGRSGVESRSELGKRLVKICEEHYVHRIPPLTEFGGGARIEGSSNVVAFDSACGTVMDPPIAELADDLLGLG